MTNADVSYSMVPILASSHVTAPTDPTSPNISLTAVTVNMLVVRYSAPATAMVRFVSSLAARWKLMTLVVSSPRYRIKSSLSCNRRNGNPTSVALVSADKNSSTLPALITTVTFT